MFKKIGSLFTLALFLFSSSIQADFKPQIPGMDYYESSGGGGADASYGDVWNGDRTSLAGLNLVSGLTFFKDYTNTSSLTADYSAGTATGTFTSVRTGAGISPGTYVDAAGSVTTQAATDNTARFTKGYYDETGFHAMPGLLMEGATTNLALYSLDFSNAAWTASNITVSTDSVLSPDGTVNADTLTAGAANSTILQTFVIASAVKTFSVYLKRKTGTGSIQITLNGGTGWTTVSLSSDEWRRFDLSATLTNPSIGVRIVTSGDAVYAWGAQLEAQEFSSSFIPTTSASLTRNADNLSYETASNRTAAAESLLARVAVSYNGTALTSFRFITDTVTKQRSVGITPTTDDISFYPNVTDNAAVTQHYQTVSKNTLYSADVAYNSSTYVRASHYINRSLVGNSGTAYTSPAWGTTFYVGCKNDGTSQLFGIVQSVAFYSRYLNSTEMQTASYYLSRIGVLPLVLDNRPRIMPVGDSITVGLTTSTTASADGGYREPLQDLLGTSAYSFVGEYSSPVASTTYSVRHDGVIGQRTDEIASRLKRSLNLYMPLPNPSGSKVLIHAGTNDISQSISSGVIVKNIRQMVKTIYEHDPSIAIYVATTIPRNDASDGANDTFNTALVADLTSYQSSITNLYIVGQNAAFTNTANCTTSFTTCLGDTLHPNATGYDVMANTWYASISSGT